MNISIAAAALKPSLMVMGPSLAEMCLTATVGFVVGAVAVGLSVSLSRRAAVA